MFENVKLTRSLENIPKMSIDQKWHIVYNNELMKWEEEKKREALTRKQIELGKSGVISEGAPEWYIRKFLDRTITPKEASGLHVSLRSENIMYFRNCPLSTVILTFL